MIALPTELANDPCSRESTMVPAVRLFFVTCLSPGQGISHVVNKDVDGKLPKIYEIGFGMDFIVAKIGASRRDTRDSACLYRFVATRKKIETAIRCARNLSNLFIGAASAFPLISPAPVPSPARCRAARLHRQSGTEPTPLHHFRSPPLSL